ncbi:hypothetical protein BH11PLA2_BH11PLA2_12850 [soil metagenome]
MKRFFLLSAMLLAAVSPAMAANLADSLKKGTPAMKSAGAMAFGPDGVLFVADPKGLEIFAIATGDTTAGKKAAIKVDGIDGKIAAMLGTKADGASIKDMKVNPVSGNVYLSVMRGTSPILLKVDAAGAITEVNMKDVPFSSVQLKKVKEGNARSEAITGIVFHKDKLYVAALPSEEFASNLRTYSFPFEKGDDGITTEIFHGAHGKMETASPVQSFMAIEIKGQTHILAGYTCTPLVKFPVESIKGGKALRGTTVAELGNMNKPLDMISYTKDGKDYVLVANSARGVMKVSTEGIEKTDGITMPVKGTAGLKYETIAALKGVMQLDKLDDTHAVMVTKGDSGWNLVSIDLP